MGYGVAVTVMKLPKSEGLIIPESYHLSNLEWPKLEWQCSWMAQWWAHGIDNLNNGRDILNLNWGRNMLGKEDFLKNSTKVLEFSVVGMPGGKDWLGMQRGKGIPHNKDIEAHLLRHGIVVDMLGRCKIG
ncbi:hypothetical protein IV203_026612 [Nitzschia inconspicua]|uniref:Uncharacterized protein n=1 Tax=Nitzschia inconspicua TaxID=303405 RepID=A0A9K3PXB5_9STRA|nr:hypothetical protein IV203_026612 [Nitzschia inconspicua]